MLTDREALRASVTGLLAVAAVGLGGAAGVLPGDGGARTAWWAAFTVFAVVAVLDSGILPLRTGPRTARAFLTVEVAAALVAWFASPGTGWTAILFVVTAVTAAYALPPSAAWAVVAGQVAAVAAGSAAAGSDVGGVALATVAYGSFQAFGCLVVLAARREAEARAALATAHAELRAASALLATSARDAERLRISRDLHDVVGHQLTALTLELEVASHQADGPAAEHVARARSVAKCLLADVRAAVGGLRDDVQGLEGALREAVGPTPGLEVHLTVEEAAPVAPDTALVLVRCVQELVTNTTRHARASRLDLVVRSADDGVTLAARDDGTGAGRLVLGNGLVGMRERLAEVGGTLTLDPGPGSGFGATVRVPA